MMRVLKVCFLFAGISLAVVACERSHEEILQDMHRAEDMDEFNRYANEARELGRDGIPILLAVLNDSLDEPTSVFSYGKTGVCLMHLHELASAGIHSTDEVPILLRAIRTQLDISQTLSTAKTLVLITGLDVGYDEEFVSAYTVTDEPRRQEMIVLWEDWYRDRQSQ